MAPTILDGGDITPMELHSTNMGGNRVTVTGTTPATLSAYQCVSSHGTETVSDATAKTTVEYYADKATLKRYSGEDGIVHVPIQNPPGLVLPTIATLRNVIVYFTARNASVDSVALNYGNVQKFKTDVNKKSTFHIDFDSIEAKDYAYTPPPGICVSLQLSFTNSNSYIELYTVSLVYRASDY
jgi:hypothetical protein